MNRIFWVIGIVLLVGTLVGAGLGFNPSSTPAPETAGPPAIMAFGYIDGEQGVAKLYPLQPGRLDKSAPEGAVLKKGDPILWLDDELASLKVAEAKADHDAALAQQVQSKKLPQQAKLKIDQLKAAVESAKLKRTSADNELTSKLASAKVGIEVNKNLIDSYKQKVQELEEFTKVEEARLAEAELIDPAVEMRRADADVAAKKSRLDQAQWVLDQCKVVAPADGTVLRVLVNPGELLGANPNRPAVEFLPKSPLVVRAEVLQEWANRVKVDQEVDITDDTYQGPTFKGKVAFLSPWFTQKRNLIIEPFTYNDVRFLECLIRVNAEDSGLRVGQRVRVKIKS